MGKIQLDRNAKKDRYENYPDLDSCSDSESDSVSEKSSRSSKSSKSSRCRSRSRSRSRCKPCKSKSVCDTLCLKPPKNACEKVNVKHYFKVTLGKCQVTRDVNVYHNITANLKHHIKENVKCQHTDCTKHTYEEVNTVKDGKHCNIKFPTSKDDLIIIDECSKYGKHSHKCPKLCNKSKKHDGSCGIPPCF